MIKADAYGHGAIAIAGGLQKQGVTRFGVATLQEGIALREAGVHAPILLMGPWLPEHGAEIVRHRLTPIIYHFDAAAQLAERLSDEVRPYAVHVKIDTGMGRLGLAPDQALTLLDSPLFTRALFVEGLMTHLADADNNDPEYTHIQIQRFQSVVQHLQADGRRIPLIHAANSAAILFHPSAHFTVVRPGIMLYGYHTASPTRPTAELRPVLSLITKIAHVRGFPAGQCVGYNGVYRTRRPSRLAVLPIGYADGYSRSLSDRGAVLIKGRRAPVVGRVCMDMTLVDVTDIPDVSPGDEAVLIGRQGEECISAADLAAWQNTIPYEVLCGIGPRVPRVYREKP